MLSSCIDRRRFAARITSSKALNKASLKMVGVSPERKEPNIVFLEALSSYELYQSSHEVKVSLESLITYCIYKFCSPHLLSLKFITGNRNVEDETLTVTLFDANLNFVKSTDVPWQVSSCIYPVAMCDDIVISGLCAVARHICKYKQTHPAPQEHEEGVLGFRHSCLQAPNEVSIWTKFCEIDVITTVKEVLATGDIKEVPKNLVRFENHLKKPVRVHNVYKIARDLKKDIVTEQTNMNDGDDEEAKRNQKNEDITQSKTVSGELSRVPKSRKWKSNKKKDLEIDCCTKIEDLNINHQFAEGPFLTLADLVLLPSYHIIIQSFSEQMFEFLLPLTSKWYKNLTSIPQIEIFLTSMSKLHFKTLMFDNISIPETEDVSLYKCDPKRHNPKKRLFTREDDVEKALCSVMEGMELTMSNNNFELTFNWNQIPSGANPTAGHLPDERVARKTQQLENLALAVLSVAKEGDLIVDFCCGSGHLGILLAYLLPKCTVILMENKEQSLLRARARVHAMGLKNVYFYQCNLDFYIGKFDVGIGLHACGIASDLVLDKCLKAKAKFVLCPCCYGSLHATDRMVYPRSSKFSSVPIDEYLCIGHAADQTHEEHPLAVRGARCMAIIDSDRGRLAEELGYKVTLSRLKPPSCTPKNNLLIGVPF